MHFPTHHPPSFSRFHFIVVRFLIHLHAPKTKTCRKSNLSWLSTSPFLHCSLSPFDFSPSVIARPLSPFLGLTPFLVPTPALAHQPTPGPPTNRPRHPSPWRCPLIRVPHQIWARCFCASFLFAPSPKNPSRRVQRLAIEIGLAILPYPQTGGHTAKGASAMEAQPSQ